jgi:hypothetical protein
MTIWIVGFEGPLPGGPMSMRPRPPPRPIWVKARPRPPPRPIWVKARPRPPPRPIWVKK